MCVFAFVLFVRDVYNWPIEYDVHAGEISKLASKEESLAYEVMHAFSFNLMFNFTLENACIFTQMHALVPLRQ